MKAMPAMAPTTAPPMVPPEMGAWGVGDAEAEAWFVVLSGWTVGDVVGEFAMEDVVGTRAAVTKGWGVRVAVEVIADAVRTAMSATTRALAVGLAELSAEKVAFMRDSLTLRNMSSANSQQTFTWSMSWSVLCS